MSIYYNVLVALLLLLLPISKSQSGSESVSRWAKTRALREELLLRTGHTEWPLASRCLSPLTVWRLVLRFPRGAANHTAIGLSSAVTERAWANERRSRLSCASGLQGGRGPGPLKLGGGIPAIRVPGRFDWSTWEIRNVGRHDIHLLLSLGGTACSYTTEN